MIWSLVRWQCPQSTRSCEKLGSSFLAMPSWMMLTMNDMFAPLGCKLSLVPTSVYGLISLTAVPGSVYILSLEITVFLLASPSLRFGKHNGGDLFFGGMIVGSVFGLVRRSTTTLSSLPGGSSSQLPAPGLAVICIIRAVLHKLFLRSQGVTRP